MSHTQQKLTNGVVTSDAVQKRSRRQPFYRDRMLLVPIGSAVLLAVIILYAFYGPRFWMRTTTTQTAAQTYQQQLATAITDAKKQLQVAKTPSDKAQANEVLGAAYLNASQTSNAISAYNNAITLDASVKTAVLDPLGYAYAISGQRDKAIATYQELVQLLQAQAQPSDHVANVYNGGGVQKYQQYITTLQAGGSL
jgi:tetratricopeptide (TPR) repeat protein